MTKVAMLLEQIRADRLAATQGNREVVSVVRAETPGTVANVPTRSEAVGELSAWVPESVYPTRDNLHSSELRLGVGSGVGFALWHRFRLQVRHMLTLHPSH
jgi:hypothetical protein